MKLLLQFFVSLVIVLLTWPVWLAGLMWESWASAWRAGRQIATRIGYWLGAD